MFPKNFSIQLIPPPKTRMEFVMSLSENHTQVWQFAAPYMEEWSDDTIQSKTIAGQKAFHVVSAKFEKLRSFMDVFDTFDVPTWLLLIIFIFALGVIVSG